MSYFAEPNHIEYDAWFDENIEPLTLWIIQMKRNLVIGSMISYIRFQLEI